MDLGADVYGIVFEKGEIVCREGDPGDTMYIIQSGAVKISRNREGEEVVLAILEPGEFFGEMALIDRQPRSATVSTMSRTRLLPLTRTSFLERTGRDPSISLHLIKILGERINRTLSLLRSKINESLSEGGDGNQEFDIAPLPQSENDPQDFLVSPQDRMAGAGVGNLREEGPAYEPRLQVPYGWLLSEQQGLWYEPDQVIFQAGDPCEAIYMILHGSVETRQHLEGKEILVRKLEPGDFFGEVALLTGQPHTTTAFSKERTCLVPIRIEQLFEEIKANSELVLHIVKLLILRLRSILAALAAPEQSVTLGRQCLPPLLKPKRRISCAVVSLSSCGGCSAALLDDQQELGKLLEKVHITYCPGCRGPAGGVVKKIREGETYNEIMLKILRQRSQMEEERLKPIIRFFSTQANKVFIGLGSSC